ncbi:MAG: hypothetical protein R3320_04105 [Nitriliruptorales bacterium]|nr:hypothetical protein [Nitriliruptorales bacterium]
MRLFGGKGSEPEPSEPSGAIFTAHSFPATRTPAPETETEPEPLFEDSPGARARERDLWDDEPLLTGPGPRDEDTPPPPPPPPPSPAGDDEPPEEPLASTSHDEERLFDRAPASSTSAPAAAPPAEPDSTLKGDEPSVSELTDELERLAADEDDLGDDLVVDDDVTGELDVSAAGPVEEPDRGAPEQPPPAQPAAERSENLFDAPRRSEPAQTAGQRGVNVHDDRIDRRPGPIRMTPSEALALAKDGPAALRRRRPGS